MKMIMAVVPKMEAEIVMEHLIQAGYTATFIESKGGVMRRSQLTLFIAVSSEDVKIVIDMIRAHCHSQIRINPPRQHAQGEKDVAPVMADVGGAVIFMWDLDVVETD